MKIDHNQIFYVYFCFIILSINSCNAQQNKINVFFNKEKEISYKKCLDNDDYRYFKQNDKTEAASLVEESCKAINSDYDHYLENTMKFLDSLEFKSNKQDFIILNKTLGSILDSKPALTIFKAKNSYKYSVIRNYTVYDDEKEKFIVLTDHALGGFNADKILNLFEDFLYYNKGSLISENIKDFSNSSVRPKVCYVIARIKGKFFIKEYYYLDKDY